MNRYPGGKNAEGMHQWLIGLQPTHTRYAELFVGSGGILKRKVPALETVVCDRDATVVDYWKRLKFPGVKAYRRCAILWLRANRAALNDPAQDWLVYLDPPYVTSTRVRKKLYRYEMTDRQHRQLLREVLKLTCRVMISGYASQLYAEALADWTLHKRWVMTRGHSWREEHLWCNFLPHTAPDFAQRRAGRDWRDRDRIRKRLKSWRGKFERMPEYERRAILAELVRAEQTAKQ